MKKIYRIIFLVVLFTVILYSCNTVPAVVNNDEYLSLATKDDFSGIPFQIRDLYCFDRDVAMRLAALEIDYAFENNYDREIMGDLYSISFMIGKNPELGALIFNYYNTLMAKQKSQDFPDNDIINALGDEELFCALWKHAPVDLKDSLQVNLSFLLDNIQKIHPDSNSTTGKFWGFISSGFRPYGQYTDCVNLITLHARTLERLGMKDAMNGIFNNLDTINVEIPTASLEEILFTLNYDCDYENDFDILGSYPSPNDLLMSDSALYYEAREGWDKFVLVRPVILQGNKALFKTRNNAFFCEKYYKIDFEKNTIYFLYEYCWR